MSEYEKFNTKIYRIGSGSHVITIPSKIVEFNAFKEGDWLIVMVKKTKAGLNKGR